MIQVVLSSGIGKILHVSENVDNILSYNQVGFSSIPELFLVFLVIKCINPTISQYTSFPQHKLRRPSVELFRMF